MHLTVFLIASCWGYSSRSTAYLQADQELVLSPTCSWSMLGPGQGNLTVDKQEKMRWAEFIGYSVSFTDKATHPTNRQEDWEYIIGFCDQINKELEGYVFEITQGFL